MQVSEVFHQRSQASDLGIHSFQKLMTQLGVLLGPAQKGLKRRLQRSQGTPQLVHEIRQEATAGLLQEPEAVRLILQAAPRGDDLPDAPWSGTPERRGSSSVR